MAIVVVASVLSIVLATAQAGLCQTSRRDVDALAEASLVYVATVRKDGSQSTPAPVWFTVTDDHLVLIQTSPTTWKAKRIRRGSPVIVWIGDQSGPAFVGKAEISRDPEVIRRIVRDFPKRYWMARLGLHKPTETSFEKGTRVAIKITPVRDLPRGFSSSPGAPAPSLEETPSGSRPPRLPAIPASRRRSTPSP
jgi:general stress protein 26